MLTLKTLERKESERLKTIAAENIPIYSIKTNTTTQIQTALKDVFDLPTIDDEEIAMREAEEAVYQVLLDSRAVELTPQIVVRAPHAAPSRRKIPPAVAQHRPRTQPARPDLPRRRSLARVFISFEGIEGSGKTSLIAGLALELRSIGADVFVTREPGGTRLETP